MSVTGSVLYLTWAVRTGPRVSTYLAVTRAHVPRVTMGSTAGTEVTRVVVGRHRSSVAMDNVLTPLVGHSHTRVFVMRGGPTTATRPRVVRMSMNVLCPILHVPKTPWSAVSTPLAVSRAVTVLQDTLVMATTVQTWTSVLSITEAAVSVHV